MLATPDGGAAPGFIARSIPKQLGGPGVVILPDRRGLHWFYERLADNFSDAGINANAVDAYHRTAGVGSRLPPETGCALAG